MIIRLNRLVLVLLGLSWLASAIAKANAPIGAARAIATVLDVGGSASLFAVHLMVVIEIVTAALLIAGLFVSTALSVSALFSTIFIGWHFLVSLGGLDVSCGCGLPGLVVAGYKVSSQFTALIASFALLAVSLYLRSFMRGDNHGCGMLQANAPMQPH